MATMISEVYSAFRKAGVPEDDARSAAEALSSENLATKTDIIKIERELKTDIIKVERELIVIKWMVGLVILVNVVPTLAKLVAQF